MLGDENSKERTRAGEADPSLLVSATEMEELSAPNPAPSWQDERVPRDVSHGEDATQLVPPEQHAEGVAKRPDKATDGEPEEVGNSGTRSGDASSSQDERVHTDVNDGNDAMQLVPEQQHAEGVAMRQDKGTDGKSDDDSDSGTPSGDALSAAGDDNNNNAPAHEENPQGAQVTGVVHEGSPQDPAHVDQIAQEEEQVDEQLQQDRLPKPSSIPRDEKPAEDESTAPAGYKEQLDELDAKLVKCCKATFGSFKTTLEAITNPDLKGM